MPASAARVRNYYEGGGNVSDDNYSVDASDGDDHSVYEPSNDELTDDEGGMAPDGDDDDFLSDAEQLEEELREPPAMPEPTMNLAHSDNEFESEYDVEDSGNEEYRYESDHDSEDEGSDGDADNDDPPYKRQRTS